MNFFWGALSTLAVAALVQILMIPWVQRRNRRVERWERDVIDLVNLVEIDTPEAITAMRLSMLAPLEVRRIIRLDAMSDLEADKYKAQHLDREVEAQAAYDALKGLGSRSFLLERRLRMVSKQAQVWDQLHTLLYTQHAQISVRIPAT